MTTPALRQERLLSMSGRELVELYSASPPGPIPDGPARGLALIAPGTSASKLLARWTNLVGWQGKTFDAARGCLVNRITPFHINAIVAKVYTGRSLLDGKPCVVLDYSKTSTLARFVRDEIRCIAPDLYLGYAYLGAARTIGFSLDFARG